MNRVFTLKTKTFLTRNLYIKSKCQITFKYKNNQIMSEEIIIQEELKKLTPIKKGELLEIKIKEELDLLLPSQKHKDGMKIVRECKYWEIMV